MSSQTSGSAAIELVQNLIKDLVMAGMSYSRISLRLNMSPSTIQKIMTTDRFPRLKTLQALGSYYVKIFENPENYGASITQYFLANSACINQTVQQVKVLLKELTERQTI